MDSYSRPARDRALDFDRCDDRILLTLVFILNGNAYGATDPSVLTADAARVLQAANVRAIQISTPVMGSPAGFDSVVKQVESMSHGKPIGIVGFSAGGAVAERLAGVPKLHVKDVLACYSPPDVKDFFKVHQGDHTAQVVTDHGQFTPAGIALFSGPNNTKAHVVATFGQRDPVVVAGPSADSFARDYPAGDIYYYPGAHGVGINASPPALEDFLAHI